jgi:hypothetical protein
MRLNLLVLLIFIHLNSEAQTIEKFLKLVNIVTKDTSLTCSFNNGVSSCSSINNANTTYIVPAGRIAKVANILMYSTGGAPKVYVLINDRRFFSESGSECISCYILKDQKPFEPIWLKSGETLKFDLYGYNGSTTAFYRYVVMEYTLEE